jgi:methenyltetrahydromethanopterin cyclohydrolase
MISVNEKASKIANEMIQGEEELGVKVLKLKNGAVVIDTGIEARGSLRAGKHFSEVCLGGLGNVNLCMEERPHVHVNVDHPAIS